MASTLAALLPTTPNESGSTTPGICRYETNISTQQFASKTHPWIPCSHGQQKRTSGTQAPSGQGSRPALPLIRVARGLPRAFPSQSVSAYVDRRSSAECSIAQSGALTDCLRFWQEKMIMGVHDWDWPLQKNPWAGPMCGETGFVAW